MTRKRIRPSCFLRGTTFSPAAIKPISGIEIDGPTEPGTVGTRGRYKDQPLPFGYCEIKPPDDLDTADEISYLADLVVRHQADFRAAGATEIVFWIRWYGHQGNMELSTEQLQKLAAMQIPLAMDYIYVEK